MSARGRARARADSKQVPVRCHGNDRSWSARIIQQRGRPRTGPWVARFAHRSTDSLSTSLRKAVRLKYGDAMALIN